MRIDHYLTRKAAAVWPGAVVEDHARVFVLRRPGIEPVVLADDPTPLPKRFAAAREALRQLVAARQAGV